LSISGLKIWALLDERAGNRSQVLGVADAMKQPFSEIHLKYGRFAGLPNILLGSSLNGITRQSRDAIKPPWPDLIIAAGRRTAPVARYIKKMNNCNSFICQIMSPGRLFSDDFDLIAAPRHDQIPDGDNILQISAAPNRINDEFLKSERVKWASVFEPLKPPRIAVLMGGDTKNVKFTPSMTEQFCGQVKAFNHQTEGSLLLTTSPRSGDAGIRFLSTFPDADYRYSWKSGGDNPYAGLLAWADHLIVTGESVSMCSEACSTGARVHIFTTPELVRGKHRRFMDFLFENGHASPLDQLDHNKQQHKPPLNSAQIIAETIIGRIRS